MRRAKSCKNLINIEKQKPFPILKVPWLALLEVWASMEPSEAFLLSLCSKRTARNVNAVWKLYRCETGVDLDEKGNISFYVTTDNPDGQRYNILKLKEQSEDGEKPDKVTKLFSSAEIPFNFDKHQFVCHIKNLKEFPLHEIHNRLCALFRIEKDAMNINGYRMAASLMGGMAVTKSRYISNSHSVPDLNVFFTSNPGHTLSIIDGPCPPEVIRAYHPISYVENLMLTNAGRDSLFLLNFKGKHLIVKNAEFTSSITDSFASMIEKLTIPFESIIIFMKYRKPYWPTENREVLREWRECNVFTNEKPPSSMFEYNSELLKYHQFAPGTFDCSEAHHFRSKVEKKLVSVKLTYDYFIMLVWKNDALPSTSS